MDVLAPADAVRNETGKMAAAYFQAAVFLWLESCLLAGFRRKARPTGYRTGSKGLFRSGFLNCRDVWNRVVFF
jgi:hypothetical protein